MRRGAAALRIALRTAAFVLPAALARAQAPQLELDVRLDPASRALAVHARWTAHGEVKFTLHRSLTVRRATLDGAAAPLEAPEEADENRLWRLAARPGARIDIEYGGTLPALDANLDHRSVLGARTPMAGVEGSFLPAAGAWYPQPAPLFGYRVTLRLPPGQRGLVPGELAAEVLDASGSQASFEFAHPAQGIDLMAGPYVVRERIVAREGAAPLRLRTWFFADLDSLADAYLDDSRRYIERYAAAIGAYPFASFSVVASPLPTGYGMPTLTYLGAQVLKLPFIRATSLGHEVLHNWWGNGVYVDDAQGNWSEGLTTFMADYAYREEASAAAAREMRLAWLRDAAALPPGAEPMLAGFRARTHAAQAAVGYGKSAMVFVMLRDLIGTGAFQHGLRRFWQTQRFRNASWSDLREAFEQAAGRDLGAFFNQWLNRSGAPTTRIANARAQGSSLVLSFIQDAPAYALHLPVELVYGERTETRWVEIDRERQELAIDIAQMPESVRLDPQTRTWRRLDADSLPPILRQWIAARAPRWLFAGGNAQMHAAARALAQQFFEADAREVELAQIAAEREPVLIAGLHADVDTALMRLGLPSRPKQLDGRGSAQVWTVTREAGRAPVAVFSARDAASFIAPIRALAHYGAQSFLVFEGAKAIERGVWPTAITTLRVQR